MKASGVKAGSLCTAGGPERNAEGVGLGRHRRGRPLRLVRNVCLHRELESRHVIDNVATSQKACTSGLVWIEST